MIVKNFFSHNQLIFYFAIYIQRHWRAGGVLTDKIQEKSLTVRLIKINQYKKIITCNSHSMNLAQPVLSARYYHVKEFCPILVRR